MDENALRLEVAICCRLSEHLGLFDFSGHASARILGTDTILINDRDSVRSHIRPQDIIKVDLSGKALEKDGKAPSEVYIHTEIYRHRPDVAAIAHLHSPAVIALSVAGKKYLPVIARGSLFDAGVPVHDDSRTITSPDSGKALAETLGRRRAVILRGHGSVVVAESVKALFFNSLFLELNAQNQVAAYQMGEQPYALRKEEIEGGNRVFGQRLFEKVWDYYVDKTALKF